MCANILPADLFQHTWHLNLGKRLPSVARRFVDGHGAMTRFHQIKEMTQTCFRLVGTSVAKESESAKTSLAEMVKHQLGKELIIRFDSPNA